MNRNDARMLTILQAEREWLYQQMQHNHNFQRVRGRATIEQMQARVDKIDDYIAATIEAEIDGASAC